MLLYHISFQEKPDSIWVPQKPYSDYVETKEEKETPKKESSGFGEPSFPRICCAESLAGCFMAVYPNVSHYFEDKSYNYPHMDFFYYSPDIGKLNNLKDLLSPKQLTDKRYVWDAHVTKEWNILVNVKMRLVGKVRFFNTTNTHLWITTHPFNDKTLKKENVSPFVKYEILPKEDSKLILPPSSKW